MSEIGRLAIVLGFVVALWGVLASVLGALRRDERLIASGKHAAFAFSALTGIAVATLLFHLNVPSCSNAMSLPSSCCATISGLPSRSMSPSAMPEPEYSWY